MKRAKPSRRQSPRAQRFNFGTRLGTGKYKYGLAKIRRVLASRVAWCMGAVASVIPIATGGNMIYELYVSPLTKDDVTGRWCVTDVVRKAHLEKYVGMKLDFEFSLKQEKSRVSGYGRKVLVDGVPPPPMEVSWIEIKHGQVSGKLITLTFIEGNDARKDRQYLSGTFAWTIRNEKTLEGTFDAAAAGSSGDSTARRLSVTDPRASCRDTH